MTKAPSLVIGTDNKPPPQPISSNFKFSKVLAFILKCLIILSLMNFILTGLMSCNGLNLPDSSHHCSANAENFFTSSLLIVVSLSIS